MATLINVILDESGSMAVKRDDVIGGLNTFVAEQKQGPDACRLSLTKFNTVSSVVHSALPISDVPALTLRSYVPGGNTALLDAIAETVRLADKEKRPSERVLCLVITDGEENASRETTLDQVRQIIAEREARGDWTFAYLGADPDTFVKEGLGHAGNVALYATADPGASYGLMGQQVNSFRASTAKSSKDFYTIPKEPK